MWDWNDWECYPYPLRDVPNELKGLGLLVADSCRSNEKDYI